MALQCRHSQSELESVTVLPDGREIRNILLLYSKSLCLFLKREKMSNTKTQEAHDAFIRKATIVHMGLLASLNLSLVVLAGKTTKGTQGLAEVYLKDIETLKEMDKLI